MPDNLFQANGWFKQKIGREIICKKDGENISSPGDLLEDVTEVLELPTETIKIWERNFLLWYKRTQNSGF